MPPSPSRHTLLPPLVLCAAAASMTLLVLMAQRGSLSSPPLSPAPSIRKFVAGAAMNAATTLKQVLPVAPRRTPPPTDPAGAAAAAAALLEQASAALGYQGMAQLRQHFFCEDAKNLEMGNTTQRANMPNLSMFVYKQKDFVSEMIAAGRGWEQNDLNEIMWAMQVPLPHPYDNSAPLFMDVGANIGWFALNGAAKGYRVAAFEGMLANLQLVRSSLCLQPTLMAALTLYPFGLGAKRERCFTFSGEGNVGDGFTMCGVANVSAAQTRVPEGYKLRGTMDIERLDEVIKEDVKVMKMDVEGYEPIVLQGGEALFRKHKVWYLIVEFNAAALGSSLGPLGKSAADFIRDVQRLGYRISRSGFRGPWLEDAALDALAKENGTFNLYCVIPEAVSAHAGR